MYTERLPTARGFRNREHGEELFRHTGTSANTIRVLAVDRAFLAVSYPSHVGGSPTAAAVTSTGSSAKYLLVSRSLSAGLSRLRATITRSRCSRSVASSA